jgi:hypothetical protein
MIEKAMTLLPPGEEAQVSFYFGCVWQSRRILWALMHAGHGISSFMLRQMEYDADSYETKLAGSDAFESTASRLRVHSVSPNEVIEWL